MGVLEKGRLLANSMMPVALLMVPGEPKPTQGTSSKVRPAFARACAGGFRHGVGHLLGAVHLGFRGGPGDDCVVFVHNANGNVGAAQVDSEIIHSPLLFSKNYGYSPIIFSIL